MPNQVKFLAHQIPSLKALGKVVVSTVQKLPKEMPPVPGKVVEETLEPRAQDLLAAYATWCGQSAQGPIETVPSHLFSQWAFPAMAKTFEGLPFRVTSILNQGAKIEIEQQLDARKPLTIEAQLVEANESDGKVRMTQRIITRNVGESKGLNCEVYTFVPVGGGAKSKKSTSSSAKEVTYKTVGEWQSKATDGQEFAFLTGDLNPIHWIPPIAKISGFKNTILHGFGILARTYVLLEQTQQKDISAIDVRFIKPFVMPNTAMVGLNGRGKQRKLQLTDARGTVCMVGTVSF